MALYRVAHYDFAKASSFHYDCMHSRLVFSMSSFYDMMYTKGKSAYIVPDGSYYKNPYRMIFMNATASVRANLPVERKLYISSGCKLPRDLVRNTGYKIVHDKDKADFVVIPRISNNQNEPYKYELGFVTDDRDKGLYLMNISRTDNLNEFDDSEIEPICDSIRDRLKNDGIEVKEFFYNPRLVPFTVQFLPKCEEYEEIFFDVSVCTRPTRNYVLDSRVEIVGSNGISIETLEIWSHMNDRQLLEKSILNSDWQKYPCTLAVFLNAEKRGSCCGASGQWRWLLNQIDYFAYETGLGNGIYGRRNVTPEDWNMLQKWIMYRLGMTEKGGFLNTKSEDNRIPVQYIRLIMSRLCVAPMMISQGETFNNLTARVGNS